MNGQVLYRRSERALAERVGEETVILDLDGDIFLRLNPAGELLWEALAKPTGDDGLATVLVEHFGIDADIATRDARAFVDDMRERGLVSSE